MSDESQWNLLVTRYFEYAIRGATCAGVRERATGEWLERHYALGNQVSLVPASHPVPGARWDLLVSALLTEVQVGPVLGIERPSSVGSQNLSPLRRRVSQNLSPLG